MCANESLIIPALIVLFAALVVTVAIVASVREKPAQPKSFLEASKDWRKKWSRK